MADSQILKALLPDNPLCGISTYKDTLNLATGACTRQIKKLVLTGEETTWNRSSAEGRNIFYNTSITPDYLRSSDVTLLCTHYVAMANVERAADVEEGKCALFKSVGVNQRLYIADGNYSAVDDFKAYLAQQYANGTPVTVWYVLATPEETTISVPSGLTGTEEGYLTQSETPTPTNPIYPTANSVEIWQHSLRKLGTATDTITTLPADLYTDGNNATVGISGNTVQSGTPTPDNPIQPQECGDRTRNLFDKNTAVYGEYINEDGTITYEGVEKTAWLSDYIPVTAGLTYTLNQTGSRRGKFYKADKTPYQTATMDFSGLENKNTFTIPETVAYIRFTIYKGVATPDVVMLNTGSELLPYEPYGYKIPISSASTTTPVYLGEVETTRKIKKYTVNIEFTITLSNGNIGGVTSRFSDGNVISGVNLGLCDRALCGDSSVIGSFYINPVNAVFIGSPTDTLNDFKSKYDGASLWYVLATPETAVVNEPLRKIGDYADTVSGITIPTIAGANSFDVLTTLKPSEVTVNYHGWHPVQSVHERENGAWT